MDQGQEQLLHHTAPTTPSSFESPSSCEAAGTSDEGLKQDASAAIKQASEAVESSSPLPSEQLDECLTNFSAALATTDEAGPKGSKSVLMVASASQQLSDGGGRPLGVSTSAGAGADPQFLFSSLPSAPTAAESSMESLTAISRNDSLASLSEPTSLVTPAASQNTLALGGSETTAAGPSSSGIVVTVSDPVFSLSEHSAPPQMFSQAHETAAVPTDSLLSQSAPHYSSHTTSSGADTHSFLSPTFQPHSGTHASPSLGSTPETSGTTSDSQESDDHSAHQTAQRSSSAAAGLQFRSNQENIEHAAHRRPEPSHSTYEFRVGALYPVWGQKLYFTVHEDEEQTLRAIENNSEIFFFSTDLQESYLPFCLEFGPVSISLIFRFCEVLKDKLEHPALRRRKVVYYCANDPPIITNTAFLMSAFLVLENRQDAQTAFSAFSLITPTPFLPFRDATFHPALFTIDIQDCLQALMRGVNSRWYDHETFDLEDYEYWDDPELGDFHQVLPKFIAFRGPKSQNLVEVEQQTQESEETANSDAEPPGLTPQDLIPAFRAKGVKAIVRLSNPDDYPKTDFTDAGFEHFDLEIEDEAIPSDDFVEQFLSIADRTEGVIAVHCYAGLGRTATMIALWMMKNHNVPAKEAIAWLRIMRPGSVIGLQQQYLQSKENLEWQGNRPPRGLGLPAPQPPATLSPQPEGSGSEGSDESGAAEGPGG